MPETITSRQLEIIEAAGRILTRSGVSGLTIKNLSKEMGFSEPAIYRHFDSKEKIIVEMLEYIALKMNEQYTQSLSSLENPMAKFMSIFQNQFSFFSHHPHFAVAVFSDGLWEQSQLINQSILKIMAVKRNHLQPVIQACQRAGVFRNDISTEDIMHIVMGSVRLQMYKWRADNFQFDLVTKGNSLIESFIQLLKIES